MRAFSLHKFRESHTSCCHPLRPMPLTMLVFCTTRACPFHRLILNTVIERLDRVEYGNYGSETTFMLKSINARVHAVEMMSMLPHISEFAFAFVT